MFCSLNVSWLLCLKITKLGSLCTGCFKRVDIRSSCLRSRSNCVLSSQLLITQYLMYTELGIVVTFREYITLLILRVKVKLFSHALPQKILHDIYSIRTWNRVSPYRVCFVPVLQTDRQTDGGNRKSEKLTWTFISGNL